MSYELQRQPERETGLAYALWVLGIFGFCGIHRLYMGRWASGLLWLFTFGLCGLGQLIDAAMMPRMIEDTNRGAKVW